MNSNEDMDVERGLQHEPGAGVGVVAVVIVVAVAVVVVVVSVHWYRICPVQCADLYPPFRDNNQPVLGVQPVQSPPFPAQTLLVPKLLVQ